MTYKKRVLMLVILLPMSFFMIVISTLFKNTYPNDRNSFYGFRSKKSMKSDENWVKAQRYFVYYTRMIFKYTTVISVLFLIVDIIFLMCKLENSLIVSILIQTGLIFILLGYLYWIVNKKI
ncbi:putative membrane protein [Staphylococcus pasteuri]